MELILRKLRLLTVLILLLFSATNAQLSGQVPPPPPPNGGPNNGHGLGGNQGPANAPIGNGFEILIVLGIAFAGKKYLTFSKSEEKD